ncbi:MAG: UbiA-like protein EboC [Flavobacteriaceae bacterium]
MNTTLKGYLQLCRLPNLPTAAADIVAGMSLVGVFGNRAITFHDPVLLIFASVFLYAGGVVLNDVFDFELDKTERPERPIPSGIVSLKKASFFGSILLILGIALALYVSPLSGITALVLALFILLYDAFSKKHSIVGPLNMGICRGLNLLLGVSIFEAFIRLEYVLIPIVFISAITLVSRGEVHGSNRKNIIFSGLLYAMVLFLVIYFHTINLKSIDQYLPFLIIFAFMVFFPLVNAYLKNTPKNIKRAVISGVLGIIALDASIAAAYSNWQMGILLMLLLPLSIFLAKVFAVT